MKQIQIMTVRYGRTIDASLIRKYGLHNMRYVNHKNNTSHGILKYTPELVVKLQNEYPSVELLTYNIKSTVGFSEIADIYLYCVSWGSAKPFVDSRFIVDNTVAFVTLSDLPGRYKFGIYESGRSGKYSGYDITEINTAIKHLGGYVMTYTSGDIIVGLDDLDTIYKIKLCIPEIINMMGSVYIHLDRIL